MADVTISYKGATIATMDASGTKTLNTQGKYCEGDIGVVYAKPTSPTGTINIISNGTYNVTDKATARVTVPNTYTAADEGKVVSNGALVSQGSDTVTQNGTVDTTLINSLTVNVSGGGGVARTSGTLTFAERTAVNNYTLDVGIDAAQFAMHATSDPLQSNGRTYQGSFINFDPSFVTNYLSVTSNASGSADSGSLGTSASTKTGTVIKFSSNAYFQAGITYQWYAWGAVST